MLLGRMNLLKRTYNPLLFVFFVTIMLGARGFRVYGSCMEPNLKTGERLIASPVNYWFHAPMRGDIVVFRYPGDPSLSYVKRVIGLPGDVVEIRNGRLYVNDGLLTEPYVQLSCHGDYGPQRVAEGYLFVLGDNRDNSVDSRMWGELPIRNIEAKAMLRYWPLDRWSVIH